MTATIAMCACGHAKRAHPVSEFESCLVPGCLCQEYAQVTLTSLEAQPVVVSAAPTGDVTKTCTACGKAKPISEFYARNADAPDVKRLPRCRDCDNSRPRKATSKRIIRVRARHRAVAALIDFHREEFQRLLDHYTTVTADEAQQLATHPVAQQKYGTQPARLRSGPKRAGEVVTDRLDVARCPECVTHHDRGHICANCGAEPHTQKESA